MQKAEKKKISNYKMLKASCDVHVNMTHISARSRVLLFFA